MTSNAASVGDRLEHLVYQARRVVQTPRVFANWPSLLWGLGAEKVGRGPATLTFRTRSGVSLTSPNVPGARLPAYEQFADDSYRLRWFLGDLVDVELHGIDVGAHVGTFACQFASVHPTATLTCYEPSAINRHYLSENIQANDLADRVTVQAAALTGASGFATFDDHGGASVHSGLVHSADQARGSTVEVPTVGFDDLVAASTAPIVFVKLDCEGGEYQGAYRSRPESWSTVRRVVLEYHDIEGESWAELRRWFEGIGLDVVRHEPIREDLGLAWLSREPL